MSQPWIKVRESLHSDPRVIAMADMLSMSASSYVLNPSARDLLGVTPTVTRDVMVDVTVSSLVRVWVEANRHTVDGVFRHASLTIIDSLSHVPGFGLAMASVGYAVADAITMTVTLPNFNEHNAPSKAGKGGTNSQRQQRWRDKKRLQAGVTREDSVTPTVTPTVQADKIREDKSNSETLTLRRAGFPSSEEQARSIANTIGVDPDYAATVWLEIEGRGGSDDRGQAVTNFAAHLKARSNHRANRVIGSKRPTAGSVEAPMPRNAAYAQYMQAKAAAAELGRKSFHTDAERQTAATRLHTLERQIVELEAEWQFTK
jgi:hypothetical protein